MRYNPDSYVPGDGHCDNASGTKPTKRRRIAGPSKTVRLEQLHGWLKHLLESPVDLDSRVVVGVIYLFFDGYSVHTAAIETLVAREQ